MVDYFYSERFKKQYKKLDPHQQELVKKKILKIVENPALGKPLHAPLQHYLSERIENLRIIYRVNDTTIQFAWLDDRGHVYE